MTTHPSVSRERETDDIWSGGQISRRGWLRGLGATAVGLGLAGAGADRVSAAEASDWTHARGGPGQSGAAPGVAGPTSDIGASWQYDTPGIEATGGAVADGTVYCGGQEGLLYALDAESGAIQWTTALETRVNTPTVADGTVYVGSSGTRGDGEAVYAVSAADGSVQWQTELTDVGQRAPVVQNDTVYVTSNGSGQGRVIALSAADGSQQWAVDPGEITGVGVGESVVVATESTLYSFDTVDGSEQWSVSVEMGIRQPPTLADGLVAVATGSYTEGGSLIVLEVSGGTEQWRVDIAEPTARPAIADSTVYISGPDSIRGFSLADGTEQFDQRVLGHPTIEPVVDGKRLYFLRDLPTKTTVESFPVSGAAAEEVASIDAEVKRPLTVAEGTVYVSDGNGFVHAYEASEGTERWQIETGGGFDSAVAVVGDTAYFQDASGTVTAVDVTSGTERWTVETGHEDSAPLSVVDGTVYATTGTSLIALSASDGSERWRYEADREPYAPAVVDGTVYFGNSAGRVYALSAADGSEQWTSSVGDNEVRGPAVSGQTVYVTSGGTVYALERRSGTRQWTNDIDITASAPVVADGSVYATNYEQVVALDAADGSERWTVDPEPSPSSLAVTGGRLSVATSGGLYAVDVRDGSVAWEAATGAELQTTAVTADTVFAGTGDSDSVLAFAAGDGSQRWSYEVGGQVETLSLADGTVYAGVNDGYLYALSERAGSDTGTATSGPNDDGGDATASGDGPGFGVLAAAGGLAGTALAALARRGASREE